MTVHASDGGRRARLTRAAGRIVEPVRLAGQTTVAAVAAFLVGRWLDLPTVSWAVFSAVFVVHANVGGTLGTAATRLAGGGLGVLIALAAVLTLGSGGWWTVAALAISVTAMSLVLARWPQLSYGLVTVTMIVVNPGVDVVEGAMNRSLAIAVGALTGTVAAILLFPKRAEAEARQSAALALTDCADLTQRCIASLQGRGEEDLGPIHARLEARAKAAHEAAGVSRPERIFGGRVAPDAPARAVEKLWYTLALLARVAGRSLPAPAAERIRLSLDATGDRLVESMRAIAAGKDADHAAVGGAVARLGSDVDALWADTTHAGLDRVERQRLNTLLFACEVLAGDVAEVDRAFSAR